MAVRHLVVLGVGCTCAFAMAGNLTPPAGPVGPTMVPLDKIESRVCLNELPGSADSTHLITQPGTYYLTGDVTAQAGKNGIEVLLAPGAVGTVTIDQNGFDVIGGGGATGSGYKLQAGPIYVLSPPSARVRGFGEHGVHVVSAETATIAGMTISDCNGDGVRVDGALEAVIDVTVRDCFGNGVSASNIGVVSVGKKNKQEPYLTYKLTNVIVRDYRITNVGGHGVVTTDCDDVAIGGLGIGSTGLDGVRVEHSVAGADASVSIADCSVKNTGGHGIGVFAGPSTMKIRVRAVNASGSSSWGMFVDDATSVEIADWRDQDCGGGGIRYHTTTPGHKYIDTLTLRSTNAGGDGISIDLDPIADSNVVLRDCIILNAGGTGARVYNKRKFASSELRVSGSVGDGLDVDCDTVELSAASLSGNGGAGAILAISGSLTASGVVAEDNGGDGMAVAHIGGGGGAGKVSMQDLSFARNTGAGGRVLLSGTLVVSGLVSTDNDGEGMRVSGGGGGAGKVSMQDISCMRNGFGGGGVVADGLFIDSVETVRLRVVDADGNSGNGVRLADINRDGMLDVVVCSNNSGRGILSDAPSGVATGSVTMRECIADSNGADGVFLEATTGGQIVDCTLTNNNGFGLMLFGAGHVVHRNTSMNNVSPFFVPVPGNVFGPLVDEVSVGGNTNPAANYIN